MAEQKVPNLSDYGDGPKKWLCDPMLVMWLGESITSLSTDLSPNAVEADVDPDRWHAKFEERQAQWDPFIERFRHEIIDQYTVKNILPDDQIKWLIDWIDAISCLTPGIDEDATDQKAHELYMFCHDTLLPEKRADQLARAKAAAAATGRQFRVMTLEHYDRTEMRIHWK